ncbi:MAG: PEP-CTERM sorting domain-containing protein [Phormidium sp. SL48-SHIP]|nr:MAG: PEP-CTERM sorting domain-containing protein [Phormidium sp. SL48-SHIP]
MKTTTQLTQRTLTLTAGAAIALGGLVIGANPASAQLGTPAGISSDSDDNYPGPGSGCFIDNDCTLQGSLDYLTVGGDFFDVNAAETGYEYFTNTATGSSISQFMFEIAGFASENTFGIFNQSGLKLEIFNGSDTSKDVSMVSFFTGGTVTSVTQGHPDNGGGIALQTVENFGNVFGFYITSPQGTFYSDDSKNPNGIRHSAIYQGDGSFDMDLPGKQPGLFTDNEFIVAFEDKYQGSDWDYNDLVVMVESVEPEPVPEPSLILGLGAMAGSLFATRKRKRS